MLYLPYDRGGLRLPNLQWYYWSAQLAGVTYWFSTQSLPWVEIESTVAKGMGMDMFLYSDQYKNLKKATKNPFVKNTLAVWNDVQRILGEAPNLSSFSPIWGNGDFRPGKNDPGFKQWALKGIRKIGDLFEGDTLMSFTDLKEKFGIPETHFFKYLQIRSYIMTKQKHLITRPLPTELEKAMFCENVSSNQISLFYFKFVNSSKESSESKRVAWGVDLHYDLLDSEWNHICARAQTVSINTRFKLIQYNWIMRTYITPEKLNKFNSDIPDTCFKCRIHKGTLFHCIWECEVIKSFWQKVTTLISTITSKPVPMTPELCVLGLIPVDVSLPSHHIKMIDICLILARRLITFYWKNIEGPSIDHWLKDLSHCIGLERVTYSIKGKLKEYYKIWELFIEFLETNQTLTQEKLDSFHTTN